MYSSLILIPGFISLRGSWPVWNGCLCSFRCCLSWQSLELWWWPGCFWELIEIRSINYGSQETSTVWWNVIEPAGNEVLSELIWKRCVGRILPWTCKVGSAIFELSSSYHSSFFQVIRSVFSEGKEEASLNSLARGIAMIPGLVSFCFAVGRWRNSADLPQRREA